MPKGRMEDTIGMMKDFEDDFTNWMRVKISKVLIEVFVQVHFIVCIMSDLIQTLVAP